MSTSSKRYDHPNYLVRREKQIDNLTGIASTTMNKTMFFQKARVKKIHSMVVTAGTNAAAGVDIYNGTTSVGEITHGTDAALALNDSGLLDIDVSASSFIDIRGKANSATMVNSYTIEYEVLPDAVITD